MGSASKIILIGATSLIIGIYAVSLKTVQTIDLGTSLVEVKRVQYERIQSAAVRTAMYKYTTGVYSSSSFYALGGGTYTYAYTNYGSYMSPSYYYYKSDGTKTANVTLTLNLDGVSRVATAEMEDVTTRPYASTRYVKQGPRRAHRGIWEVTKYYVQR
jgi:hypothetical protein